MQMARARTRRVVKRPAPTPMPALWPGERPVLVDEEVCIGDCPVDEAGEGKFVLVLVTAMVDVLVAKLDVPLLTSEDCHSN